MIELMTHNEAVLILDFGGQYSQLIARRVRDLNVYCEIKSYKTTAEQISAAGYKGIIFSGGPDTVYDENAPKCDQKIFELGIPVLGICYGAQLMAYSLGGSVDSSKVREYGKTKVSFQPGSALFSGLEQQSICWMSHTIYIAKVPDGFQVTATSETCPTAAMENAEKKLYALQFHPEVEHTAYGNQMLKIICIRFAAASGTG